MYNYTIFYHKILWQWFSTRGSRPERGREPFLEGSREEMSKLLRSAYLKLILACSFCLDDESSGLGSWSYSGLLWWVAVQKKRSSHCTRGTKGIVFLLVQKFVGKCSLSYFETQSLHSLVIHYPPHMCTIIQHTNNAIAQNIQQNITPHCCLT